MIPGMMIPRNKFPSIRWVHLWMWRSSCSKFHASTRLSKHSWKRSQRKHFGLCEKRGIHLKTPPLDLFWICRVTFFWHKGQLETQNLNDPQWLNVTITDRLTSSWYWSAFPSAFWNNSTSTFLDLFGSWWLLKENMPILVIAWSPWIVFLYVWLHDRNTAILDTKTILDSEQEMILSLQNPSIEARSM